jgi:hypothetical protein
MRRSARGALAVAVLAGCAGAAPVAGHDPEFGAWWHDGRAELDGYRLVVQRYGHPRAGQGVLVYVTEPLSIATRVKVDDPARHPGDVWDVLKLNAVRDFQTGIYDYNTMVSTFVRTDDLAPVKVSFSSAEWCGHVYEELRLDPGRIAQTLHSYFEGESGDRTVPRPEGGVLEDELLIRVRSLRGPWLGPGEARDVPFLPGTLWRRLAHRPLAWGRARVARARAATRVRVPAGSFEVTTYTVQVDDGRTGVFDVETDYPHRVVRWSWQAGAGAPPLGGTDEGELTGSVRTQYWQLHQPGDERWLDSLGMAPTVR